MTLRDERMAWRGTDLKKDDIAFDLTPGHATALQELLHKFRQEGLGIGQILPKHCRHPALDTDLARVFDEIQEGRGIVIIRGIPVDGFSVDDVSAIFWAIGCHFGRGVSQSARGDLLGLVRDETPPGSRKALADTPLAASCRCTLILPRLSALCACTKAAAAAKANTRLVLRFTKKSRLNDPI
jgi:hypothetical protein